MKMRKEIKKINERKMGSRRSDRSHATYGFMILGNVFPVFLFQDITSASTPYNDVRCRVPQTHAIVKDRKHAQPTFCSMITQSLPQKTVDMEILQHRIQTVLSNFTGRLLVVRFLYVNRFIFWLKSDKNNAFNIQTHLYLRQHRVLISLCNLGYELRPKNKLSVIYISLFTEIGRIRIMCSERVV